MSMPKPGTYYIVNQVTTPDGTELAVTYDGANNTLKVIEKGMKPSQRWIIGKYDDNTQTIAPEIASTFQIAFKGSTTLTVLPAYSYVWAIRGDTNDNITIQSGSYLDFWGLQEASVGQEVQVSAGNIDAKRSWKLIPV